MDGGAYRLAADDLFLSRDAGLIIAETLSGAAPLYRLSQGDKTAMPRRRAQDELLETSFKVRQGEIAASKALRNDAAQLRETTMEPRTRSLLRVVFTETDSRPPAEIKETKRWVKN